MLATFLSHPIVFGTSWAEVLVLPAGLAFLAGLYRIVECHQTGCRRLGRFKHGHLRLCHVHHPLTPDDGRITAEHINAVTKTLSQ
jgi:hypothetical protein